MKTVLEIVKELIAAMQVRWAAEDVHLAEVDSRLQRIPSGSPSGIPSGSPSGSPSGIPSGIPGGSPSGVIPSDAVQRNPTWWPVRSALNPYTTRPSAEIATAALYCAIPGSTPMTVMSFA